MDYIKQAEKKVVKTARAFQEMLNVLNSLERFGNKACKEYVGRKRFFEGLQIMRDAVNAEYVNATSDCFMFAGVGGEEALEYSKQQFKEWFGRDDTHIMSFLEEWGNTPPWYETDVDEEFRKQCKEKIKEGK